MLAEASRERARAALGEAIERAERAAIQSGHPTHAAAVVEVEIDDPVATVFASRLAADEWFCWTEKERGFELASLGSLVRVTAKGPARFTEVASGCVDTARASVLVARDAEGREVLDSLPAGTGPVWVGGFAFSDEGATTSQWSSFDPGAMTLPELSLCRQDGRTHMTLNAVVGADGSAVRERERLETRLGGLRELGLPMLDPHPSRRPSIAGRHTPEHFERAVEAAARRMQKGSIQGLGKVVLAREVIVSAPWAHDPAALFGALRDGFPSCFCFCCGTREGAFVGASPELLVRRSGASALTVALAGSTRRSSDPALDDHLGERLLQSEKDRREHSIVADRIARTLRPHSVWVEATSEPGLAKIANIQHLATPIAAQLRQSYSAIELAGLLHPTPAVGGEPWPDAAATMEELEEIDRGWYAGPVGWMDLAEDGEFCVALRSALLRDRQAHLYAGVGVVPGSEPTAELAETETKLEALLPLLAD